MRAVLNLIRDFQVKGVAHITGGGLVDNLPRILPQGCQAIVDRNTWTLPPIFRVIQERGGVSDTEMLRTFNCGVGMVVVVPEGETQDVLDRLEALGEKAWSIGEIREPEADGTPMRIEG